MGCLTCGNQKKQKEGSLSGVKIEISKIGSESARSVALVGIHCFFFISDCLASMVARDYLPRSILSADDSFASGKPELKVTAGNWKVRSHAAK